MPLRTSTVLLAKQAATLDRLSGGRLVLGLAVGGRPDDFEAVGADFGSRGSSFERQLAELNRVWSGDGGVGPAPAIRRRLDDGGGTPDAFREAIGKLRDAWRAEGREGEPRTLVLFYFALGEGAEETARENLGDYYAWLGA